MLGWAKEQSQKPKCPVNRNNYVGRNPILLAVLLGHKDCMQLLHDYGFRIPHMEVDEGKAIGEQEQQRMRTLSLSVTKSSDFSPKTYFNKLFNTSRDNPVQNAFDFKGYADPSYLTIAFKKKIALLMEDQMWKTIVEEEQDFNTNEEVGDVQMEEVGAGFGQEDSRNFDSELEDLQRLDPLRKAFDLAASAEAFTNDFQGIVELKQSYREVKENLELFTHDLLSQCYSEEEAATIMKHNPDDDDDDDLDPEEQNWQRALWDRRKRFVGHPFYQV